MEIRRLNKRDYQGYRVWDSYQTETLFEVTRDGDSFLIHPKKLSEPVTYELPLTLFETGSPHTQAFGLFDETTLVGFIEGYLETWNKSYRITQLYVDVHYRRRGWATQLMDRAQAVALASHARQIILETQNTNVNAMAFYRHYGFTLIGLNLNEYHHEKAHQEQVRLDFAYQLEEQS